MNFKSYNFSKLLDGRTRIQIASWLGINRAHYVKLGFKLTVVFIVHDSIFMNVLQLLVNVANSIELKLFGPHTKWRGHFQDLMAAGT